MKNILTPLLFCIFSTSLFSQDYSFEISKIPINLLNNANSVVLFEDTFVNVKSQNQMTIEVNTAVTVLNKLGDYNSHVYVHFDKNQKIKSIETYIYNASGKEINKVKSKEYEDVSAVDGGTLYGDSRMLYYKYTPISYPYTIQKKYVIETINTGFVPSWQPVDSYSTSVLSSSYQIKSSEGLAIRFKEKNFENYTIEKEVATNNLKYKVVNVEAIKREPYCPIFKDFTPYLLVGLNKFSLEGIDGEANNWAEFGKWRYDYLLNGNDEINDSAKSEVLNLVDGILDPIEKAKIIYKYVQDRTRYISVQEGIGGWMPIKANDVHRLGYGDCKGLSNYTKALLNAVGVEAYYTIIWAGDENRDVEEDFFSMQGNHIILNLPTNDGDIWLECTNQKVPFGYLGDFTDDRNVLVIKPDGGIIKRTKIYEASENLQKSIGSYEVRGNGSIQAEVKIISKGTQYFDNLKSDGASDKELDVLFKDYFSHINNIKFSELQVINNKKEMAFEEEIAFEASNYAILNGNEMLVPINAFNRNFVIPKRVRERKLSFQISQGYLDVDEVDIKLPVSFDIEYVPENKTIESKFGKYIVEVSKVDEHTYLYKRTIQINEGEYPKEEYELYRNFRKEISKYDNSKIILKSKS
ncbi:DUF3857 domain-containing protein [Lutibacter sp. HS1-25]|uniref:DUF3857 domain-containing protein n=1 Tax=Lutibacter sp. HS1-25 TaxID=2485000 RepID=UPI00101117C9|nr:DUF3857 domain-containing protein [Lutibacter sp. HS1-25]RXP57903.1 DUF3857 domain-containing protein [Lutibacter sp. HS1-25]